jgi:hypothetical protein
MIHSIPAKFSLDSSLRGVKRRSNPWKQTLYGLLCQACGLPRNDSIVFISQQLIKKSGGKI